MAVSTRLNLTVVANTMRAMRQLAQLQRTIDRLGATGRLGQSFAGANAAFERLGAAAARSQRQAQQAINGTTAALNRQSVAAGRLSRAYATSRPPPDYRARMGLGMGAAFGGAGAAFGGVQATRLAQSPAMAFGRIDQAADAVAAITRIEAGSAQDLRLRETAAQLGASTPFTTTQVTQGQEFLARAGMTPDQIVGSLPSTLDLSLAGWLDLGTAADIQSDIGTAMGMISPEMSTAEVQENMTRLADVLSGTAMRSNTDVMMLGDAMKYAAPLASQFGLSLEETAAAMGVMADAGIKSSMAGTAMRGTLLRLADPPKEAAEALAELEVETTFMQDGVRTLRPFRDILADINAATADMGSGDRLELLTRISGVYAAAGFSNMLSNLDKMNSMTGELEVNTGESSQTAQNMQDNLPGDITKLTSALSALSAGIGKTIEPTMRSLVQGLRSVVTEVHNFVGANPELVKYLALTASGFGALLAVGGGLVAAIGALMIPLAAMQFATRRMGLGRMATAAAAGGVMPLGGRGGAGRAERQSARVAANAARASKTMNALSIASMAMRGGPVVAGIAAVAASVYLLANNWDAVKQGVSGFVATVNDRFPQVGEAVASALNTVRTFVDESPILSSIGDGISNAISENMPALEGTFARVQQGWSAAAAAIGNAVSDVRAAFSDVGDALNLSESQWQSFGDAVGRYLTFAGKYLGFLAQIAALAVRAVAWGVARVGELFAEISRAGLAFAGFVIQTFTGVVDFISELPETAIPAWEGIVSRFEAVGQGIADAISNPIEAITGVFDTILGRVNDVRAELETVGSITQGQVNTAPMTGGQMEQAAASVIDAPGMQPVVPTSPVEAVTVTNETIGRAERMLEITQQIATLRASREATGVPLSAEQKTLMQGLNEELQGLMDGMPQAAKDSMRAYEMAIRAGGGVVTAEAESIGQQVMAGLNVTPEINVQPMISSLDQATAAANRTAAAVRSINTSAAAVQAPANANVPARALGGPVVPGQAYMVGERGRELVAFQHAAHVFSAASTSSIMAKAGQVHRRMAELSKATAYNDHDGGMAYASVRARGGGGGGSTVIDASVKTGDIVIRDEKDREWLEGLLRRHPRIVREAYAEENRRFQRASV